MLSMPNVDEGTSTMTGPVHPTFGPPRTPARKPRVDAVLAESTDLAKSALMDFADEMEIGDHIGVTADDERLVTHRFASRVRGYRGWEFFATLARAPRSKVITVCETGMLPGDEAMLAPAWVPWMDRASEEERIRLDAIAAGEDPVKALEAAGYGAPETEEAPAEQQQQAPEEEQGEKSKQARRDAKRRRAKKKAASQKKNKKSGGNKVSKASKSKK